jgi:hypothetical protein
MQVLSRVIASRARVLILASDRVERLRRASRKAAAAAV